MFKGKWFKGRWQVSKEIASQFMQIVYNITKRGFEIIEENETCKFLTYHPAEQWEKEKKSIESHIIILQALFPDIVIDCEWELVSEKEWKNCWRNYFKPIHITPNLTILPANQSYKPKTGEIAIWIKSGMAFGTGMHETTQLCLKTMYTLYKKEQPQSMLDVGTGTGILAILGEKLGIKDILAIDIDPLAIAAAKENLKLNQTKNIKLLCGGIESINKSFDWLVANLETKIIIPLSEKLKKSYLKSLILSGILESEIEQIKKAIALPCRQIILQGQWACLIF